MKMQRRGLDRHNVLHDLNIYNQRLTLTNLYGPNTDDPTFFKKISNIIEDIGNTDIILCGIRINGTECKFSQYPDDTTMFLDWSTESLNQTLWELECFANVLNAKKNCTTYIFAFLFKIETVFKILKLGFT